MARYHFGDDAGWADPKLDDSAWPVAPNGIVPAPDSKSDGFVWVRVGVPVPPGETGGLAIRQVVAEWAPGVEELFVIGRPVAHNGNAPPHPVPMAGLGTSVFPLDHNFASPGGTAVVALRAWTPPIGRGTLWSFDAHFEIDREGVLRTAARERQSALLLRQMPEYILFGIIFVVGLGLLLLWRATRRRELALFGASLIFGPAFVVFRSLTDIGFVPLPLRTWDLIYGPLQIAAPAIFVVFLWTSLALPGRRWGYLLVGISLVAGFSTFLAFWLMSATPLVRALLGIGFGAALVHGGGLVIALAWSIVRQPANRVFATLMALTPVFSLLSVLGMQPIQIGAFSVDLFQTAVLVNNYSLAALLIVRAWKAWREGNDLRVEIDAAREVQQQMVVVPPAIAGFRIESVYAPATQVGGDFYRVREDGSGGVQIVVGDVSGKGLRAAMTVSAIVGALRTMPYLSPARVLGDLNRGLAGNVGGGFVTCCVAHIARDGQTTVANAGHLSPFRDGMEMECGGAFPLGLAANMEYEEAAFALAPGEKLTFFSDGVLEARNPSGELFGFDRMRAISRDRAEAIAAAAQAFGQEDDITVLTLTLMPVEGAHA